MKHPIWLTLAVALLAGFSLAQTTPAADIAVAYSPLYIVKGFTIWNNGGSASVAVNVNQWFGVAGDFGGYVGHIPQILAGETYVAGPRFSYRKLNNVTPYAQALFGGSHFSESTGGITGGVTSLTLPSAEEPTSASAPAVSSLCAWEVISSAFTPAVLSPLQYASILESCTA
jgi:hypothetical protein